MNYVKDNADSVHELKVKHCKSQMQGEISKFRGGAYPGIIFVRDDTCNVKETATERNESRFLATRDYGSSTFAR